MSNIFTRKALNDIMNNEGLTPEQRTEQVFGLYGRALDDGYIAKGAAAQAQETALANAKAEWEKTITHPDPKESDEYKALQGQFSDYKAMQQARGTEDYKRVKDKFFETVYGMIDRKEGAKPVSEQMAQIESQWGEYFNPAQNNGQQAKNTPQYSQQPGHSGTNPTSEEDKLFKQLSDAWK
jgi:hypothetical protein